MWNRALILFISVAMLFVSGAEAMSGHCAKSAQQAAAPEMSHHCAEMMGLVMPSDSGMDTEADAACCCVITTVPITFTHLEAAPYRASHTAWMRPLNTFGPSAPDKVAIPPPRG